MSGGANPGKPSGRRVRWVRTLVRVALAGLGLVVLATYALWVFPFWGTPFNGPRHGRPPLTPSWALECWLWEDDVNTAEAARELLEGYAAHDIPVRTLLIDSPWSTRYNDFQVDTQRYPEPEKFFRQLQAQGYRVVLWMTCMVNATSKDTSIREDREWFESAKRRGYLAGDGDETRWWKGSGGFIDYTNPDATAWWQGLQEQVLAWGIDGWKLDGADTLFHRRWFGGIPLLYQRTRGGWMTTRGYMDHYARAEYAHGLSHNPEFATLIRAIDLPFVHPEGFAPLDAAPVTWVGDRTHEWNTAAGGAESEDLLMRIGGGRGFESALRDILLSAQRGYCVVGSDIGGYHGQGPIPPRLYIRWAQFAAFSGLFLNGGHGERRLWRRSPEELAIIRKFAWLHTELVPYLYTQVVVCHEGGPPLMRPTKGKYHYQLGDDLLVAPIYRDDPTNRITLPPGRWRYLFNEQECWEGPAVFMKNFPLDEFPVFVRDGAILPLKVSRAYTGFGDTNSAGRLTLAIYPCGTNSFALHHPDASGTTRITVEQAEQTRIVMQGSPKPHILRIHAPATPSRVWRDDVELTEGPDWRYDGLRHRLWITAEPATDTTYRIENAAAVARTQQPR